MYRDVETTHTYGASGRGGAEINTVASTCTVWHDHDGLGARTIVFDTRVSLLPGVVLSVLCSARKV